RTDVDWSVVVDVIHRSGLKSGAWATLKWTQSLFDSPVDSAMLRELAPSRARQRYLLAWVAAGPASLYERSPLLVRGAFSLALQDHPRDAARAIVGLMRAQFGLWTLHS
ncbi:MAG: hypothetical protein H7Z43_06450, partial [Clostridia bacterium]|nr:hypothetical protein [Deltaproteobacteria bacterium]